jgi:hypothetical protein
LPYLYPYINIQSKKLFQVYGSPIFERINDILENIPYALDVHAQRVLKYNFILIYDFTIIETRRFNVFL